MKLNENMTCVYIVALVGIVAAVALILLIMSNMNTTDSTDISGAAVQSTTTTYTKWTTCLDKGDSIKLGNTQGGTLEKKDVCTGTADKMISLVSCAQDVDGYYTYKYSNPIQCSQMESCKKDSEGYAYCG